ncbi:MAG: hypothetical protein LUC33_00930 [Prevotellaceae bacterium]|nr:hypothetical protein [Prevotellaceae bacterium]
MITTLKYGYGCRIKATLLNEFGDSLFLQRSRGITAVVVTPLGLPMNVPKDAIRYNEYRNDIHVVLAPRVFASEGVYRIVVNVRTGAGGMVASKLTPFVAVAQGVPGGTADADIVLNMEALSFPASVNTLGGSPKISANGTWLVFNDVLNAYEDTGIAVGYAELAARYDAKYAEILQPAVQATDAANEAATAANEAATKANTAADNANDAADNADDTISQMEEISDEEILALFDDE